jgi:hypothetical protein
MGGFSVGFAVDAPQLVSSLCLSIGSSAGLNVPNRLPVGIFFFSRAVNYFAASLQRASILAPLSPIGGATDQGRREYLNIGRELDGD